MLATWFLQKVSYTNVSTDLIIQSSDINVFIRNILIFVVLVIPISPFLFCFFFFLLFLGSLFSSLGFELILGLCLSSILFVLDDKLCLTKISFTRFEQGLFHFFNPHGTFSIWLLLTLAFFSSSLHSIAS